MGGMRKLAALAFALSSLALFAERDMAIYRGKLTSDLNANGNRITSVGLPLDAGDAANKEYVDAHGGGCDTNAVDALANAAVVTNALTVSTTNRVAALETAMDEKANSADIQGMVRETMSADGISSSGINIGGSISGQTVGDQYGDLRTAINGKADKTIPSANGNLAALTADGNLADSGIAKDSVATKAELTHKLNDGGEVKIERFIDGNHPSLDIGNPGSLASWFSVHPFLWHIGYRGVNEAGSHLYGTFDKAFYLRNKTADYEPTDKDEIAVKGDISDAISANDPAFSNAVLAVQISTNDFAALYALKEAFADLPIDPVTGGISIGALLAALASAVAWLKKNKVGSFASVGGSTATVENGVAKLGDFFTESNSLLNGRITYSRNATGLKDRAFNTLTFDGTEYNLSTALAAVTPTASGQPRDLLIVATATAATTISFTAGTIKGDKPTIDGSGTWLITLTEYASGVWYCRQIKMEDAA